MSIESIGGVSDIMPPQKIESASKSEPAVQAAENKPEVSADPSPMVDEASVSTKDFLALRVQPINDDFAVLDEVINKMKENIDQLGEAIEGIMDKTQKVAKMAIGLQVLKATFEAIDEIRQGPGGGQS